MEIEKYTTKCEDYPSRKLTIKTSMNNFVQIARDYTRDALGVHTWRY